MEFLVIPFPNPDPVALYLGPVHVKWYGLAYMAGLLLGWLYVRRLIARPSLWSGKAPLTRDQADNLLLWTTLGVVVGGRLGFVLFYEPGLLANPAEIPAVWHGGMAFHGGVLGVVIATWLFSKVNKLNFLSIGDGIAAAVPIGLFFGRIANFINGEVFGRPTDVPWALVFPLGGPEPRHPSQLYEAFFEGLVLFFVLSWLIQKKGALSHPGFIAGMFLIGYAIARIFCEFFRDPDADQYFTFGIFSLGMLYSVPMLVAGIYLVNRSRRALHGAPA